MTKGTLLNYISQTENIELVSDANNLRGDDSLTINHIFSCNLLLEGRSVGIKLCIPSNFPYSLPQFYLPRYDILGFIPHIEPEGRICYFEKESAYINVEQPEIVFQGSVELAIQTLKDGLNKTNSEDFREEFHVFWERNKNIFPLQVLSFIEVGLTAKPVRFFRAKNRALLADEKDINDQRNNTLLKGDVPFEKPGYYFPLKADCPIIPPKYTSNWSFEEFKNWLKSLLSEENREILSGILTGKNSNREEYLILGIPRKSGMSILVGIRLAKKFDPRYPLLNLVIGRELSLLRVKRLDPDSHLPRSGASLSLQGKNILLIGCGSVGSHLAIFLAKSGVGKITLVDDDRLELENIQRFAIGLESVGKHKVDAIRDYLKKNYLHTTISAFPLSLDAFWDKFSSVLQQYDIVVSAIGDPTYNLFLNEQLQKRQKPLIIGWNEPMGIGGHAVISLPSQEGCYRCLFRDTYNIASFAARDQSKSFHKKHLGCGEVFTPYSPLDSIRTSELMTRLITRYLEGNLAKPQINSWKGDSTEFLKEGFQLSSRYLIQSQDTLDSLQEKFVDTHCPHCNKPK